MTQETQRLDLYRTRLKALESLRNKHKRRAMGRKLYYSKDDQNNLVYRWEPGPDPNYHHILATHAPNDIITLTVSDAASQSMTAHRRIELICNGSSRRYGGGAPRIHVWSDKSRHKNKKQHIRLLATHQQVNYDTSLPLTMGLQVRDAYLLNPEICLDYVRKLDSLAAAYEVRRRIDPMVKLTKVLGRMGQLHVEYPGRGDFGWNDKILDKVSNIFEPNADDARFIVAAGMRRMKLWRYPRMTEAEKKEFDKRAVANGLAILRKELYEKHSMYTYVLVTN